jgi:putative copper resistance protein D
MRDPEETYQRIGTRVANPAIAVEGSEEIVAAYSVLARAALPSPVTSLTHVEFLIDRQGWVRTRWIPGEAPAWSNLAVLLAEVARLDKEALAAPPPEDHVH